MAREITVQLIADATKFKEGMASALPGLAALGAAVVGVGAGIAAVSLKMAGDFQASTDTLITGAGESVKNIEMVRQGILSLSPAVGVGPEQLVKAMFMIESAGFHGAAALKVLTSAAEGAKVGNADLGITADAVTTVMKDYKMAAGSAADATNFLVSVVSQGKTHMEDLAGSLAAILPTASALHIPLNQMGGAIATLTARGTPAADAATYLRFTLSALAAETPAGAQALRGIGLSAVQLSDTLTKKGLLQALELIQEHLAKKFPQGGGAMFATLKEITGGTRGLGAALGLTGQNLADFAAATAAVGKQIDAGKGKVIGWDLVQQSFNQRMDQWKARIEVIAIQLGTKLLPIAIRFSDWLLGTAIPWIQNAIKVMGTWHDLWNSIGNIIAVVSAIVRFVFPIALAVAKDALALIIPTLQFLYMIFTRIVTAIQDVIRWFGNLVSVIANSPLGKLESGIAGVAHTLHVPGFAAGTDYVPQTMLAVVHQGEQIIPAGQRGGRGGNITINLFATVADGPALDRFTNDIAQRLKYATGI